MEWMDGHRGIIDRVSVLARDHRETRILNGREGAKVLTERERYGLDEKTFPSFGNSVKN